MFIAAVATKEQPGRLTQVGSAGIDIEVTESLLLEHARNNIEKLKEIRRIGVNIAIDDFGTGYSSLSYLARLPLDSLKIDRSFIAAMLDDPSIMTLVSTMIALAHSLKLKVIAEGGSWRNKPRSCASSAATRCRDISSPRRCLSQP